MAIADEILKNKLVEKGLLKLDQITPLLTQVSAKHISLEQLLFDREILPDETIGKLLAEVYEVPFVKLTDRNIPDSLLRVVPYTMASHQYLIAFERTADGINLALSNPDNYELINLLGKKIGLKVNPFYATPKDIKSALKAYNRDVNQKFTTLLKGAMDDPTKIESLKDAAKILDTIILFAYQNNASDIHMEPHRKFLMVRYRIDGLLHSIAELPIEILDLLVTRVKVLANLRTDEHRAAQDGRFRIDLENNEITLRVSIIPVYAGEKTVLRLLSSTNQELNLESIGYSEHNLQVINNNIAKTHGIILMTGPTGSGKTTTLYTLLKLLNSPEVNISTIEDPIEYQLEGINQIQVNAKTDLTFANGLRALLRQDPDIVMVGEIRDEETASIAINAALTGHLVVATLHTNDAASTLPRMLEMDVESFLLAATVQLVIAQRLVRKICSKCTKPYTVELDKLNEFGKKFHLNEDLRELFSGLIPKEATNVTLYKGEGCTVCNASGFKGRTSIAETLEVSETIRKLILDNASPTVLEAQAKQEGMIGVFQDGLEKVLKGITTIEEILRVMRS
ncbi:MAG: GspE/PulE family protein [Candidatus Peregrinibacteria bacterium]|nr:GspE/PulE family protein [Candidatus Peregrinibacteria bacterium]